MCQVEMRTAISASRNYSYIIKYCQENKMPKTNLTLLYQMTYAISDKV